jgi:ketosteroid isomerase-like protein
VRYLTGLLVLGWACATSPQPVDTEAEAAELMRISREWSNVAASGDVDGTLAYWRDDAVMMPPGLPPLRGRAAIREFVAAGAATPGFSVRWEPLEAHVSAGGDMAYLIERNQFTFQDSTGATITESNKVITIWRRQPDGTWKNVVDMWNADPTAWQ